MLINIKNTPNWEIIPGIVYIGRPSAYGNPFTVKKNYRNVAVDLYENYVRQSPDLINKILLLRNAPAVACFYNWPHKRCHYEIIKKIIEE